MKQTTALQLLPKENNPRNSEGTFAELRDGRILFVYSHYSGESWSDDATSDLMARVSADGGRSWSEQDRLVVSHGEDLNVMSPSLLRLQDGRLALLYLKKSASAERGIDCMPYLIFSEDDGETWSETSQPIMPFGGYHVVNNDRMIQLESGRIIVPVAWHRTMTSTVHDTRSIGLMLISDDGGKTFREAKDWLLPPQHSWSGLQEPGVIDLKNNHLMAYFRTDLGCQFSAFSSDGGEFWSVPQPTEFRAPISPMSMKRHPQTGDLYAIWNDHDLRWNGQLPKKEESSWMRTPLVMARSTDNGATWRDHQLIEADGARGYCYTAMLFNGDDALLLAYCCGGVNSTVLQETKILRIQWNDEN